MNFASKYLMGLICLFFLLFSSKINVLNANAIDRPPNIIVILADDLGYGDLGGYFGGEAKTPNIDRLAREGMLFTDFHSNGTMCSPTRASLLTGRYSQRLGIETAARNVFDLPQNKNEITVADYLRDTGYTTGIFGKWHVGRPQEGNPIYFGFDKFIGFYGGDVDYHTKIDRHGIKDWWYNEHPLYEDGYVTDLITKHSTQFIRDNKNKPFFLYVAHLAPHFPWQSPEDNDLWVRSEGNDYTSNLPGTDSKLGPHSPNDIPNVLTLMIEEVDKSVGLIISTLKDLNLERDTFVFFSSDNGQYINYVNEDIWAMVGSNGPLRGQKAEVWEGGHRVPAIAWWPGKIPALSVSDETILTMDLLPTLLDLLNIDLPAENSQNLIDGVSILPVLFKGQGLEQRALFWRSHGNKAVRYGQWKLVIQRDNPATLYNLTEDIVEKNDLSTDYPEKVEKLKKMLDDWEKSVSN